MASVIACGSSDVGEGTEGGETGGSSASGSPSGSSGSTAPTSADSSSSASSTDTPGMTGDDSTATSDSAESGESGTPTLSCTHQWSSGFEQGFPGEWLDYDGGGWSPDGTMPPDRVSAWTIIDDASGEPIWSGAHAYKGWIEGAAADSHRAYPGIHTNLETPLVNTFWVWLEADYDVMAPGEWIHFGTWGNDDGMGSGQWALHTMSVRDRRLEFAHTDPFPGEYIGPQPQPEFPRGQWVRFTAYIHYEGTEGFVQVWQDGVPMLRASVAQLAANPGTALRTAHWGMYASAETTQGTQYNDDVAIWSLAAPLTDLEAEPDCWLGL